MTKNRLFIDFAAFWASVFALFGGAPLAVRGGKNGGCGFDGAGCGAPKTL